MIDSRVRKHLDLLIAQLVDLKRRLRGYSKLQEICDNASIHVSRDVR